MSSPFIYKTPSILILWLVLIQYSSCKAQNNMQAIQFIPKAFHDVKLGLDHNVIHSLTPYYPETDDVMKNEIAINSPKKIIFNPKTVDFAPIIPVCAYFVITFNRYFKFIDQMNLLIHIKKTTEEEWFSGEIIYGDDDEDLTIDDDEADREEKRRQERIKEAQKYTLEELEDGQAGADAINVNILDYVKTPLTSGFYEVYMSRSGLESNRMQVEIVFEK